jgi:hypothetical protein
MLTVEARAGRKAAGITLPRQTPNPAFEPAPGKFTGPEDADADCDTINWQ